MSEGGLCASLLQPIGGITTQGAQIDAAETNRLGFDTAYHGSCADDQQRGRAVACPLPGFQRGKLPGMPTVASPFGKGAYVSRIVWIAGAALLLAAVTIPSVLFATQGQTETEARINAYKHEDGRIEFGMQLREGDGWGERILPRGRYLPLSAPTGRWLNSTSVIIDSSPMFDLVRSDGGRHNEYVTYYAGPFNDNYEFRTYVRVESSQLVGEGLDTGQLTIFCGENIGFYAPLELKGSAGILLRVANAKHPTLNQNVLFRALEVNDRGVPLRTLVWDHSYLAIEQEMWSLLRDYHTLQVFVYGSFEFNYDEVAEEYRVPRGAESEFSAGFDISDMFDTPVQANIDNMCGG